MTAPVVVHADFSEDLRLWLHTTMTRLGWELPDMAIFRVKGVHSDVLALSIAFMSGLQRRIPHASRRVEWSQELRAKALALSAKTLLGVQTVEAESLAGENLNARLSKQIQAPADFKKLDMLLFDWGISHLHLGHRVVGQPFVMRDDPLLFVRVTEGVLYFIDILPHGAWEDERLMLIVWRNWRHLLSSMSIPGGDPWTQAERKQLRAAGAVTPWRGPDGVNYRVVGTGYSTARTSNWSMDGAIELVRQARDCERICREKAAEIAQEVGLVTGRVLNELHLSFRVDPDHEGTPFAFAVEETSTKVLFRDGHAGAGID